MVENMGVILSLIEMLIYSIETTCIICAMLFTLKLIKKTNLNDEISSQLEAFFMTIILIVISSLRYGMGSDYFVYMDLAQNYYDDFGNIFALLTSNYLFDSSFQIGFPFLAIISHGLFDSKYAVFFLISCIIYPLTIIYCQKKSVNLYYSFAVYLLFGLWGVSLNILKQALAMVFLLYAFDKYKEREFVGFVFLSVIAFLFHTTALVVAVLIVLSKCVKAEKKHLIIMIASGVLLKLVMPLLLSLLGSIALFSKYYNRYVDGTNVASNNRSFLMIGVAIEVAFIIVLLMTAIRKNDALVKVQKDINSYISVIMIGIPFGIIGISGSLWLSARFALYFFQFLIILIPALMGSFDKTIDNEGKLYYSVLSFNQKVLLIAALIAWHVLYAVLMLDNNSFEINTLLLEIY